MRLTVFSVSGLLNDLLLPRRIDRVERGEVEET